MSLPTVTQTWTYSFNNRNLFSTLLGTTGSVVFSLKSFLVTTMGYTVKGSCNGVTGAMDGTDRITSAAAWATRASSTTAAQSWIVLTDGAGIDWLFAYEASSDDVVRLSHSQGGNYVAASTTTFTPTATDECFDSASGSWINSTTSLDRVWHMWGSSDKKMFRLAVYRSGVLAAWIKGEKFTSAIVSPATFSLTTGGGTQAAIKSFYFGATISSILMTTYGSTTSGDLCRVHATGQDINLKAGMGGELIGCQSGSSISLANERPALQGGLGELIFPTQIGSVTANTDGKVGSVIDQWYTFTSASNIPAAGDIFGALQFFSVTTGILVPLDGVTVPVTS